MKCKIKEFICNKFCAQESAQKPQVENSTENSDQQAQDGQISFDDFLKLDLRVGLVKDAQEVEGSDKLLKTVVDFGELGERTVVSGIKQYRSPQDLIGKKFVYLVNLPPRKIFGTESQAMILAALDEGQFAAATLDSQDIKPGTKLS